MNEYTNPVFDKMIDELDSLVAKLYPWYSPQVKNMWTILVYDHNEKHLFDIYSDHYKWYDLNHLIPNEACLIIKEIQDKLLDIEREVFDL